MSPCSTRRPGGWTSRAGSRSPTIAARPIVNADTLLVAGAVGQGQTPAYRGRGGSRRPIRQAGTESADRERLGDFYLYPLPERTTIANRQTKQVSFLDVARHAGAARL